MPAAIATRWRGTLVCVMIALASTFVSEHYGGPQLLYALLLGLAFNFLYGAPQIAVGVDFCGRKLLRVGVALMGARISIEQVAHLGLQTAVVIVCAVVLTIGCGALMTRLFKRPLAEGILSGGAVGICGASAALAIASVLPNTRETERLTLLNIVGVTVFSTVAMVLYPFLLQLAGLNPIQSGIFLGGTIHDVAQVVAAGMLLGPDTADTATVVKLFRVLLLLPIVFCISLAYRNRGALQMEKKKALLVPVFLIAFIFLVAVASTGALPPTLVAGTSDASRWLLVIAIAAAGVKTSFEDLLQLGWKPIAMLTVETIFLAFFVLAAIFVLHLGMV